MGENGGVQTRTLAIGAILGAGVLFGSTGTAQELGPDSATPAGVGAVRIVIGAAGLWLIAGALPSRSTLRVAPLAVLLGAIGVAVYQPAFFTGTDRLGVALGTIVALGSAPAFAGCFEVVAGRAPSRWWMIGTVVSVGGGALLVLSEGAGARLDLLGLLGALAAGAGYATYALATKHLIERRVPGIVAAAWQFTIGALMLSPLLVVEPLAWIAEPSGLVMALHLGLVCTALAYALYGWGLRLVPTSTATTLTLAEPVTAAVLAIVVLGERLSAAGWLGVAVVVAGLAIVASSGRRAVERTVTTRARSAGSQIR